MVLFIAYLKMCNLELLNWKDNYFFINSSKNVETRITNHNDMKIKSFEEILQFIQLLIRSFNIISGIEAAAVFFYCCL